MLKKKSRQSQNVIFETWKPISHTTTANKSSKKH